MSTQLSNYENDVRTTISYVLCRVIVVTMYNETRLVTHRCSRSLPMLSRHTLVNHTHFRRRARRFRHFHWRELKHLKRSRKDGRSGPRRLLAWFTKDTAFLLAGPGGVISNVIDMVCPRLSFNLRIDYHNGHAPVQMDRGNHGNRTILSVYQNATCVVRIPGRY